MSIAFANEIASICEKVGADADHVAQGLKSEERIGAQAYLKPGGPFSGGTLARDVRFLSQTAADVGCEAAVISAIEQSNNEHAKWASRRILDRLKDLAGEKIAVLGLTYKPGTDTLRRSSSVELCQWLAERGSIVQAYDPSIKQLPDHLSSTIHLKNKPEEALQDAGALVVATECPEFRKLSAATLLELMRRTTVVDANGFLRAQLADDERIDYVSVGTP
jgi:UDPglucose 6-dehydrogenase